MTAELPPGWTREFSKSQQREYFHHLATKRSVWSFKDLNCAHLQDKEAEAAAATTNAVVSLAKNPVSLKNDAFRLMVMTKLKWLTTCPKQEATSFTFEPCLEEVRNVVHEIAVDLGGLVTKTDSDFYSQSDEEMDLKSVTAYKMGFAPEDDDPRSAQLRFQQLRRKKKKDDEPPPKPAEDDLQRIGTKKRDRRTIEEVAAELTKKHRQ